MFVCLFIILFICFSLCSLHNMKTNSKRFKNNNNFIVINIVCIVVYYYCCYCCCCCCLFLAWWWTNNARKEKFLFSVLFGSWSSIDKCESLPVARNVTMLCRHANELSLHCKLLAPINTAICFFHLEKISSALRMTNYFHNLINSLDLTLPNKRGGVWPTRVQSCKLEAFHNLLVSFVL